MRTTGRRLVVVLASIAATIMFGVVASATSPTAASGTFTDVPAGPPQIRQADGNIFIEQAIRQTLTGTFTGTAAQTSFTEVHASGEVNFHGTETCRCVVEGRAGTLVFGFSGTGEPSGAFEGHFVILSGTGGLSNLHGQGSIMGPGPGSVSGTYSGEIHFSAGG
jgi:hypothetical protein